MFGYHEIPLHIEQDGIILSVKREGENLRYKRACLEEEVEKTLLAGSGKILLNPVEPLNKPKVLTRYLLIEFNNALVVEPKGKKTIFLTFPIEIAVYISSKKQFEVIDILSLPRQKFALYGDPRNGLICKYWRSAVSPTMLSLDPLWEGHILQHYRDSLDKKSRCHINKEAL